ncbi:ROK family protein [Mucilaginibacter boryungensis]|uniref:ROK family protein n=1 Tax=Mucilaginibacter boryungensis TaxID=768480 RepID=A0ABR9XBN4_9SPHI|nr:ROK family protein [Mucilaginibacter boryungensis]MBE9664748.1 ROK family protein [Mucilaginibacter boryungensis]
MNTDFSAGNSVLGVYISGYHITTLIVNLQTREVLRPSYQRKPINSRGTATEIIDACSAAIQHALTTNNVQVNRIGIAMPGPFDYEKGISYIHNNKKHEALYGLNIKEMLAAKLNIPTSQIHMLNDAAAFLKGEVFAGAAQGYQNVIGLTLGTGLGTARLINGIAEDASLWDSPFLDSIAEDYLSERWFLKRYYELSGINVVDVKELATFYNTSNTVKAVFKEFAGNLALFAANFVRAAKPEIIVLSGDIASKASDCFLPAFKAQLSKLQIEIPVCVSKLNSEAVLIGVATTWL